VGKTLIYFENIRWTGVFIFMNITSAKFIKGIVKSDLVLENSFSQVAFVGRSNVGKSSIINSLVKQKNLARASNDPGRTREINIYLINESRYWLDLPGYGYAKASKQTRNKLQGIIFGYLFESRYKQKRVVLAIDFKTGPLESDLKMLDLLEENKKKIIILANKTDKVKPSLYKKQLAKIQAEIGRHKIIPYSAKEGIGRAQLLREILQ
jgi:GTP-binding protein